MGTGMGVGTWPPVREAESRLAVGMGAWLPVRETEFQGYQGAEPIMAASAQLSFTFLSYLSQSCWACFLALI